MEVLGLDIGGANLKAAYTNGTARTQPFALWTAPHELADQLLDLIDCFPSYDRLAVTMTGEMCDCFATKRTGVKSILKSVDRIAEVHPVLVWSQRGLMLTAQEAREQTLGVASANWHALATLAGRWTDHRPGLLMDIGSTTTDLVPLNATESGPRGRTDPERLRAGELCYTGARRTPVCSVLGARVAAEFFATMQDVYLVLGETAEDEEDLDTADARPATASFAKARLARMWCGDDATVSEDEVMDLARQAKAAQIAHMVGCINQVVRAMPQPPRVVVLSGSGAFLAESALSCSLALESFETVRLEDRLGRDISHAACAFAVATLARESGGHC